MDKFARIPLARGLTTLARRGQTGTLNDRLTRMMIQTRQASTSSKPSGKYPRPGGVLGFCSGVAVVWILYDRKIISWPGREK